MQPNPSNAKTSSIYNLKGKRIVLERVGPVHCDFVLDSLRNETFWKQYRANQPRNLTKDQLVVNLEKEIKVKPERLRKIEWVVFQQIGDVKTPIGFACLADFIPVSKKAELLIGIIEDKHKTNGAALETTLLVMDFAFNKAKLNKLISYVYTENQWAQVNTLSIGFQQEGLLREHVWDNKRGVYLGIYQNGFLLREFRSNKRIQKLSKRLLGRDITELPTLRSIRAQSKKDDDWSISVSVDY